MDLLLSLTTSCLLLALVYWVARRSAGVYFWPAAAAFLGGLAGLFCCLLPLPALTGVFTAFVFLVANIGKLSPGRLIGFCFVATLVFHGGVVAVSVWEYTEMLRLYPVESLADRLTNEKTYVEQRRSVDKGRDEGGLKGLAELDGYLETSGQVRSILLSRLHESTIHGFVNSSGFGSRRRILPSKSRLRLEEGEVLPFVEPWSIAKSDGAPVRARDRTSPPDSIKLNDLHLTSTFDFVNPSGFGYVLDRQHVRGFQPHHFHAFPKGANTWQVMSIELVSMLKHDPPEVYVTSNLPRMQELATSSTRALDAFEQRALQQMLGGKGLEVEPSETGLRMMGPIRAFKSCQSCHEVEHGDLLGAFSYRLEPRGQ